MPLPTIALLRLNTDIPKEVVPGACEKEERIWDWFHLHKKMFSFFSPMLVIGGKQCVCFLKKGYLYVLTYSVSYFFFPGLDSSKKFWFSGSMSAQ